MDKQKQIEEMAKATGGCDYPHRHCEKCWCKEKDECGAYAYAKTLTEKGYRKIPENAVVLTEEEIKEKYVSKNLYELLQKTSLHRREQLLVRDKMLIELPKETAKKFAERVHNLFNRDIKDSVVYTQEEKDILKEFIESIDEICKEFTEGKK